MTNGQDGFSTNAMVGIAAALGAVVWLVLWLVPGYGFLAALLYGVIVGGVVYLILLFGFGGGVDAESAAPMGGPTPEPTSEPPQRAAEPARDAAPAAKAAETPKAAKPAEASGAAARETPAIKPSARLAGEEDLAARKGEWKYQGDVPAPKAKPKPKAKAQPKPASKAEPAPEAAGTKPDMLGGARPGGPDNLKEIKGVGPKLEQTLNQMGVYHFDQIAGWGPAEVAWMDGNLKGFKGRVSRDGWVEQAKILAAGGETEFSSRVDKGGDNQDA